MSEKRTVRDLLKRVAPVGLAAGLVFAATQAHAWGYNGGYSRYYGGYSRHYGGYGYRGYRGGYPYRRYSYGGYGYGRHGYYNGLAYGLLSIPGAVIGSVFGYPYNRSRNGSAYSDDANPGAGPTSPGGTYNGDPKPVPQSNITAPHENGASGVDGSGWARLADGQYTLALSVFAAAATNQPKSGRPKVGYALSAAAAGDLRRGVWAMRRALEIDPDSIHYVTIDASLRPRVERLVTRYRTYPDRTSGNADAAFMLASLHYLLGDVKSARIQVDLGVAAGDRSSSAANLAGLIDKKIAAIPRSDTGKRVPRSRADAAGDGYSSRNAEND